MRHNLNLIWVHTNYLLGVLVRIELKTYFSSGQTALHKAVAYKWRSICCILIAGGASMDITDHKGLTPKLLAIQNDDHELAAYFESKYSNSVVIIDSLQYLQK